MQPVRSKARTSGLKALALSFVLPHEQKPMRLPVVPATLTSLLSGMAESTIPIADGVTKRAFLCRDPTHPLWVERTVTAAGACIHASVQTIPATEKNRSLPLPSFDAVRGFTGTTPQVDGVTVSANTIANLGAILGRGEGNPAIYIPENSFFSVVVDCGFTPTGVLEAEIVWFQGEDQLSTTVRLDPSANTFSFACLAGGSLPAIGGLLEGITPVGFCYMRGLRIGMTSLSTAITGPSVYMGWATNSALFSPGGSVSVLLPFAMPVEFLNSRIPYQRTRLNASAALFTNVTAALSKEGTVLAARLKQSSVDPWVFKLANVDSVHPALRYYGPLEKGLYTFTTPSGNLDNFDDFVYPMAATLGQTATFITDRAVFDFRNVGVYNAMLFSDLGSSTAGTQLAVSQYVHLEFETTSSLFQLGVSTQTLEALHATEVALLKFGHFHENPLHWAALRAAATAAMRFVGPMVAPVVEHYGQKLVQRGVAYLQGKPAGDRSMQQASLQTQRTPKPKKTGRKAKPKSNRKR